MIRRLKSTLWPPPCLQGSACVPVHCFLMRKHCSAVHEEATLHKAMRTAVPKLCASAQVPSQGNKGVGMCSACLNRLHLDMCSSTGIAANMSGSPTASPSGGGVRRA